MLNIIELNDLLKRKHFDLIDLGTTKEKLDTENNENNSSFNIESQQTNTTTNQEAKKVLLHKIFQIIKKIKKLLDTNQFDLIDLVTFLDTENNKNNNFDIESQQTNTTTNQEAKKTSFYEIILTIKELKVLLKTNQLNFPDLVTLLLKQDTENNQSNSFDIESQQTNITINQEAKKTSFQKNWTKYKKIDLKNLTLLHKKNNSEECPEKKEKEKTQFNLKKSIIHDFKVSKKIKYTQECPEIFSKLFSISQFNKNIVEINNPISVNFNSILNNNITL